MLYMELKTLFQSAKDQSKGKPIAGNTRIVKTERGFGIMFHSTVIFNVSKSNRAILNNGGWESVTTKKRLNEYLPTGYYIFQKKGDWFLKKPDGTKQPYQNGYMINLKPKEIPTKEIPTKEIPRIEKIRESMESINDRLGESFGENESYSPIGK